MPLRHNAASGATTDAPSLGAAVGVSDAAARGSKRIGDEEVLDAVRRLVLTHGMERVTLTDVAREAGLSRMTVYRRWSGLPELLGRMMQREWDRVLSLDGEGVAGRMQAAADLRAFLVDELLTAARQLRESELLRRILTAEPHLLTPYLVERSGTMHRLARRFVAEGIEHAQGDGSVRAGDPDLLATAVVLTVQSWVVSLQAGGAGQDAGALDDELRTMLLRYLAPTDPTPRPLSARSTDAERDDR